MPEANDAAAAATQTPTVSTPTVDAFDVSGAPDGVSLEARQTAIEAQLAKLEAEKQAATAALQKAEAVPDPFAEDPIAQRVAKVAGVVESLKGAVENINATITEARKQAALNQHKTATIQAIKQMAEQDPTLASNPAATKIMLGELASMIDDTFDEAVDPHRQFTLAVNSAKAWRDKWKEAIDRRTAETGKTPSKEETRKIAEKLDAQERASTTVAGSTPPTVTTRTKRPRTAGEILAALSGYAKGQPAGV